MRPTQPHLTSQPPPHQFTSPYVETYPHPMQATNWALVLINLATLLLSIPIFVVGIWLAARHHAHCLRFLEWPFIVIGLVMMVVSLIGLLGALRRRALLLWVYLCLLTLIILLLLAFTIFTFVVTRGSKGHHTVQGADMKEYVFGDYSHWMRKRLCHDHTWDKIKRCLLKHQVCNNMDNQYPTQSIMFHSKLSYVESGCCKPPTACCFTFMNATNWVNPVTPGADTDCGRWSNDPAQLCYNCDSCKAGVIRTLNKDWRKAAKVALAILIALALLYLLAWLAFVQALAHKTLYPTAHSVGATRPQTL